MPYNFAETPQIKSLAKSLSERNPRKATLTTWDKVAGQVALELTLGFVVITSLAFFWVKITAPSHNLWKRFLEKPWFDALNHHQGNALISSLLKGFFILILFYGPSAFCFEILLPETFQNKTKDADHCRHLANEFFKELREVLPEQNILIEVPQKASESNGKSGTAGGQYLLSCETNKLILQEKNSKEVFLFLYQDPSHSYELEGVIAFQRHRRTLLESSPNPDSPNLNLKNLAPVENASSPNATLDLMSQIKWDELDEPKPFYKKLWFWAAAGGTVLAGVGSYFIYKSFQTPRMKIEFH